MSGVHRGVVLSLVFAAISIARVQADGISALSHIQRSLAFVDVQGSCDTCNDTFGSGFVAWQDDRSTYVVTAAHVLNDVRGRAITVYLAGDTSVEYHGRVLFYDRNDDVAVIGISRAPQADIAHLVSVPASGTGVYSIGYGAEAVRRFIGQNRLAPIATIGIVQRAERNGRFVSSSRSEMGQSGGPIVDELGDVVGMVISQPVYGSRQVNRANVAFYGVTAAHVAQLLGRQHIPFQGDFTVSNGLQNRDEEIERAAGPIHEAADAGRIALAVHSTGIIRYTGQDQYSTQSVATRLQTVTMQFLQERTHSTIIPETVYGTDESDVARLASTSHAAGGVFIDIHLDAGEVGMFTNRLDERIDLWVVGPRDEIWFHDRETYTKQRYFPFSEGETSSQLVGLVGSAFHRLQFEMGGDSGYANFARYGVPVGFGVRAAFARIELSNTGAGAVSVGSAGVAGRSGLRDGDVIARIDGRNVSAYSQDEIDNLLHGAKEMNLTILGADGREYAVVFSPETIRWYVDHARLR